MTTPDPRLTPVNDRVAANHLVDIPPGVVRVTGQAMAIGLPVVDLLRRPDGPRDRQLLMGDMVQVYEDRDGWAFVQADKDGYVGYLPSTGLRALTPATHWVSALATTVYDQPDMKSPDRMTLSLGSRLTARSRQGRFVETDLGFVPAPHLRPVGERHADPVDVATRFIGTPYLWGGNSRLGLDCSGLVQAALLACGHPCPGDSDQQQAALGRRLPVSAAAQRGDLLFWKGHVALVAGPNLILHANGHHMAVQYEGLALAVARIKAQGDGDITAHKRL